jgi:hypothetical protein
MFKFLNSRLSSAPAPSVRADEPASLAPMHPASVHFFDFAGGIIGISPGADAVAYGGIGGNQVLTRWSRPRFIRRGADSGYPQVEVRPRVNRRPSARGTVVTGVEFRMSKELPSGKGVLGIISCTVDYDLHLPDLQLIRTGGMSAGLQIPKTSEYRPYFNAAHMRALEVALLRALPCRGELAVPASRR